MTNTFSAKATPISALTDEELARRILADALGSGEASLAEIDELLRRATDTDSAVAASANKAFFRGVVEANCDLFDEQATTAYAKIFAHVVAKLLPHFDAAGLLERYYRVRQVRVYKGNPARVCVLSRVTLGADVVVTSVLLRAAARRFPEAEICLVGPPKNAELFAADSRVTPVWASYGRSGGLRDRLLASDSIRGLVDRSDTLVIDPDSRLTQLGIVPVCAEENYLFFESRAYGGDANTPLAELTSNWAERTLGVPGIRPYLRPARHASSALITVSLGVGENFEKLAGAQLEEAAIGLLASLGHKVLIERGGGGEETERVDRLITRLGRPANVELHTGSFASFADHIMQSRLYFGYDSAGQHVAAAAGVPLVSVFAGFASERTFQRWRPTGTAPIHVIKVSDKSAADTIERTLEALTSVAAEAGLS